MPDLILSDDLDVLLQAAAFSTARTSLSLTTLSTTTPGTGVETALGVNVGSTGSVLVQNGALGTPSSGTLTSCTDLPISGVSGLGSGIATFLATPSSANLRSAITDESGTGVLLFANGALGTPASGTLTSCTGLPVSTGITGTGTGVLTALGVNVGSAGAIVVLNGALGTPSSGTLTNCTGLPLSTLSGAGTGVLTALAVNTGSAGAFAVMGGSVSFVNVTHSGPEIATSVSNGAVTANATINTAGIATSRTTAAGAVSGIRLQAGTVDGQRFTVVHESAASATLTMAAASTSNVADGTGTVIAGLTAASFIWNATTARWYREK